MYSFLKIGQWMKIDMLEYIMSRNGNWVFQLLQINTIIFFRFLRSFASPQSFEIEQRNFIVEIICKKCFCYEIFGFLLLLKKIEKICTICRFYDFENENSIN